MPDFLFDYRPVLHYGGLQSGMAHGGENHGADLLVVTMRGSFDLPAAFCWRGLLSAHALEGYSRRVSAILVFSNEVPDKMLHVGILIPTTNLSTQGVIDSYSLRLQCLLARKISGRRRICMCRKMDGD